MPLIDIPKDARKGQEPCGECHLKIDETCDICGAHRAMQSTQAMRDRLRELSNVTGRDDYDRAVICVVNDLEALLQR